MMMCSSLDISVSYPWIQNMASLPRNGRIFKVLQLGLPHFQPARIVILNAIATLEWFFHITAKAIVVTETASWILDLTMALSWFMLELYQCDIGRFKFLIIKLPWYLCEVGFVEMWYVYIVSLVRICLATWFSKYTGFYGKWVCMHWTAGSSVTCQ